MKTCRSKGGEQNMFDELFEDIKEATPSKRAGRIYRENPEWTRLLQDQPKIQGPHDVGGHQSRVKYWSEKMLQVGTDLVPPVTHQQNLATHAWYEAQRATVHKS